MTKPKIAAAEKPAPKAKQPIVTIVKEENPKKTAAQTPTKKPKSVASKVVPEAKAEQPIIAVAPAAKPKNTSTAQKPVNKPKTASPKPAPNAKDEQPVVSVDAGAKAIAPKTVVPVIEAATPERASLPSESIWPDWVENLFGSLGIKKK